jgi:hypothetical protein
MHATFKHFRALSNCIALVVFVGLVSWAAQNANSQQQSGTVADSSDASPIYGVTVPAGYRDWRLISITLLEGGNVKQLRAQLANDIAIEAFRDGKLPFPDGAIIAALHWDKASSDENNKVLANGFPGAGLQSFVAGSPVNVQFMVKDSRKYASTGGWGFGDFTNGKPGSAALHGTCFSCHEPAKDRDYVFTRYAP